jgi:hypothetical protein
MARIWVDLRARGQGRPPLFISRDGGGVEWADRIEIRGPSELRFDPDGHDNGRHVILFCDDADVVTERSPAQADG